MIVPSTTPMTRHPLLPIRTDIDRFAEAISHDTKDSPVTVRAASEQAGISYDQGNAYMQRLRRRYRG